jgi:TRAP-type uncharacterized transport system fused permease subunit
MATAWQAMRLGVVLFIVPFMFVYSPTLLMMGSWPQILLASGTAALGVVCLAAGLQGWLRCRATLVDRAILLGAGILLVFPDPVADTIGLAGFLAVLGLQSLRRSPGGAPAPAPSLD